MYYKSMKCAFLRTKIAASFETAKRNLLKSVKGFEKVRFTVKMNFRFECYPRFDFLAAIRADSERGFLDGEGVRFCAYINV